MKRFNALKKVKATPMTREAYNNFRGWYLPADEDGSDEGYLTEDINGESNVDGYTGYVSWTPKAMFDDQFYEVDDEPVGVKCSAPQDPGHELTEDEVATLASGGSLCDCVEITEYSDLPKESINAIIEAYSSVTSELIGISNPCSCYDPRQVADDIKKVQSEDNSLTHSDDLSQMLEDEHPEAGKIVREYFKSMIPHGEDVEYYENR